MVLTAIQIMVVVACPVMLSVLSPAGGATVLLNVLSAAALACPALWRGVCAWAGRV